MEFIRRVLVEVKLCLFKIPKFKETGFVSAIQKLSKNSMENDKIEGDENDLPNKKLCVEGKNDVLSAADPKIKKRNVAVLLAYIGKNYYGMQVNTGYKTIEKELLDAFLKANLIPSQALDNLYVVNFQRAARTDKGVSAARQVVSLKLGENFNVETINSYLPEDIRVFSIKRVTKGFNSKSQCTARTYSYTLPTFALAPELHEVYPENYRINEETIQKTNEILSSFVGTHPFHNFTIKKVYQDPSVKRYIMSFKADDPFIDGEEFITLRIKGQSFMLHQIRKMVGYTIGVLKGTLSPDIKEKVWKSEKVSVPIAPSLGLMLENIHYDRYDKKFGNDGVHESLTWDDVAEDVKNFKEKFILPNIIKTEITERSMFNWLQYISNQNNEELNGEHLIEDKEEAVQKEI